MDQFGFDDIEITDGARPGRRAAPGWKHRSLARVVALNALIRNKKTTLFFTCWQWLFNFPFGAERRATVVPEDRLLAAILDPPRLHAAIAD
jgi:hypothetical protein